MKVSNMIGHSGNEIANQFILTDGSNVTFQSYKSTIAIYDRKTSKLYLKGEMWDYSVTTRRYFKKFVEDETPYIYGSKGQFIKHIKENELIEVHE